MCSSVGSVYSSGKAGTAISGLVLGYGVGSSVYLVAKGTLILYNNWNEDKKAHRCQRSGWMSAYMPTLLGVGASLIAAPFGDEVVEKFITPITAPLLDSIEEKITDIIGGFFNTSS
jgi:hypothetical protein